VEPEASQTREIVTIDLSYRGEPVMADSAAGLSDRTGPRTSVNTAVRDLHTGHCKA